MKKDSNQLRVSRTTDTLNHIEIDQIMPIQTHAIDVMIFQFIEHHASASNLYLDFLITLLGGAVIAGALQIMIWIKRRNRRNKIIGIIQHHIKYMFLSLEGCESIIKKRYQISDLELKVIIFDTYISKINESVRSGTDVLDPEELTELINNINGKIRVRKNLMMSGKVPENKMYEEMLEEFKNMKWLKIERGKLNFIES